MDETRKSSSIDSRDGDDWDRALLGRQLTDSLPSAEPPKLLSAVAGSKLLPPLAGMFVALLVLAGSQSLPNRLLPSNISDTSFSDGYRQIGEMGLGLSAAVSTAGREIGSSFGQAADDLGAQSKTLVGNLSQAIQDAIYIGIDFVRGSYRLVAELVGHLIATLAKQFSTLTDGLNSLVSRTEVRLSQTAQVGAGLTGFGDKLIAWLKWPGQWLYGWWQKVTLNWQSFLGGGQSAETDFNTADRNNILEIKNNVRAILEILSNDGISALPQNGAVIVPSTGNPATDAELKSRIASMFSDQVSVSLDDSRQAGIVTPVFRKGRVAIISSYWRRLKTNFMSTKRIFTALAAIWLLAWPVWAQESQPSFSVTPGKAEFTVGRGQADVGQLTVTNNLGQLVRFAIGVEDIVSNDSAASPVSLLGSDLGPYSIQPYVAPTAYSLLVPAGESRTLNFDIIVPAEAPAGTRHGAITVTAAAAGTAGAKINAQLASLVFLRIPGESLAGGQVTDFGVTGGKSVVWGRDPAFYFTFANTGNVYLNPYGLLELSPIVGLPGETLVIAPNFVLPGGSRIMEVGESEAINWRLAGWYRATLRLNRGYNNEIDERQIKVVLIPWWLVLAMITLGLVVVWRLMVKLKRH